jgi:hypothetical protein
VLFSRPLKTHSKPNQNHPIFPTIQQAVCDRGYVGAKVVLGANIILPKKALKRDNRYQQDKKRKLCLFDGFVSVAISMAYGNI